jgi:prophage regulatory protein
MAEQIHAPLTILRRKQVEARTGLSRSTIYERIAAGSFPSAVNLGGQQVGWVESEIEAWIAERIKESRANTASPKAQAAQTAALG